MSRVGVAAISWVTPWRFFALVVAMVTVVFAVHPFTDVDVYWHVRLGEEIVRNHRIHGVGQNWTYTFRHTPWVTTQWLSEVILYLAWRAGGWAAIAAVRVVLAGVVMVTLARLLLRGRTTVVAPVVFMVTAVAIYPHVQERPVLASLAILPWLAGTAQRLRAGERVSPVAVFALTWLWANLHGYWVLVPFVLALVVLGDLADNPGQWRRVRRPAGLALLALAAAAATPVGPRLLLTPVAFTGATRYLQEWAPTTFASATALPYVALVVLLLVAWARNNPVPRGEIVYSLGLIAFSATAIRNVIPAAILLSPVVADRLGQLIPRQDVAGSTGERRRLAFAIAAVTLLAGVLTAARFVNTPVLQPKAPVALAQRLAAEPGPRHVLNDYNVSGYLLTWGGKGTQLAVDGRADRYGAGYLKRYAHLQDLYGDWRPLLRTLDPGYAVLDGRTALAQELQREGWHTDFRQYQWVLLRRP